MRNWMAALVATATLACPAVGLAHEGHMHKALGTIASVQGDQVEIKTTDGKIVTVTMDKKTTITRGTEKLDATALKIGERVSLEYMEAKKIKTAHAFKLGAAAAVRK